MTSKELKNFVYKSLDNYFVILENYGYYKKDKTNDLIILTYIKEVLSEDLSIYLTQEDKKEFIDLLYSIFGTSCIIPFADYIDNDYIGTPVFVGNLKITQEDITRSTEESSIRTT